MGASTAPFPCIGYPSPRSCLRAPSRGRCRIPGASRSRAAQERARRPIASHSRSVLNPGCVCCPVPAHRRRALPSSCVSAAGSPPLLPMSHSHSTCAIQLRIWIDYPSIEDPPLVRADALQMLCSQSVTMRCECTQSAVESEAVRGAWPLACAGRARFMRLGRLDLTSSLRAFCCRAPSCKSLGAAPSALQSCP